MSMKSIKFLFAGAVVALSCTALADPSSEQIGNYTWYYQIVDGKSAQICRAGDAMGAVNPKPEGPLTIPAKLGGKPVTSIADYAFSLYDKITSVTIPDTVTNIGEESFTQNGKLQCVQFGKKVNRIGSAAFYDCKELKSIVFKGNAPTDVDDIAFDGVRGDCCVYRAKAAKGWENAQDVFSWMFGLEYTIGDCMVEVPAEAYSIKGGSGTVTGGGQYAVGKKVSFKAKADAGSVFCGWMSQDLLLGTTARLGDALSYSGYTVTGESVKFVGRFITVEEDVAHFALKPCAVTTTADGALDLDLTPYVATWSEAKLTLKGLPAGLKYDAKAFKITGKATKPGIYKVTASATNVSVKKAITAEWTITVPNFKDELIKVEDKYGDFIPGCEYSRVIDAAEGCTVTGLPAGMKWTAKDITDKNLGAVPANSFYGAATKPGLYTVYFTKTVNKVKHTATSTFAVGPLLHLEIATDGASGKDKVTGAGDYAANAKVSLKATADKGKVFSGWYDGEFCLSRLASYQFNMISTDFTLTAKFVGAADDANPANVSAMLFTTDEPIALSHDAQEPVAIIHCGVQIVWPISVEALSATTVKVSGLPSGLKFTAKPILDSNKDLVAPANSIYGVPTKAGPYSVKITVTTAGKNSFSYDIFGDVNQLDRWAVGPFEGYGGPKFFPGPVSLAIAENGKISGKFSCSDGSVWTLSAPYFYFHDNAEDEYHATVTCKSGKNSWLQELTIREPAKPIGAVAATMAGDLGDMSLYQTFWSFQVWKDAGKKIDKKKLDVSDADAKLSMTFSANGSVKMALDYAGYKASCSSTLIPLEMPKENENGSFLADVFFCFPANEKKGFPGYVGSLELRWNGSKGEFELYNAD